MPTVDRIDGFRVVIYPNGHRPEHVHVIGPGVASVWNLHCPDGPLDLRENYGFSRPAIARVKTALSSRLAALCEEWRKIHGTP
jgi:hypothetical protein